MQEFNYKLKNKYLLFGFISVFTIGLVGVTIEDILEKVPFIILITNWLHFVAPVILGFFGATIGYFVWKIQLSQAKTLISLLKAEQKFHSYINSAPDSILLHNIYGDIIEYNNEALNELGYKNSELKALKVYELETRNIDIGRYQAVLEILVPEHSKTIETELIRKNGSTFPVEIRVCKIEIENTPHYLSLVRNITERKKAEIELAESKQKFKVLYEKAPLAYQSLNNKGCFIDINPAWEECFGYTKDEVIGKHFSHFMTPESKEKMKTVFEGFKKSGSVENVEFQLLNKNREIIYVIVDGKISYNSDSKFEKTHCILTDITQKRKDQLELIESEDRFKKLSNLSFEGILIHERGIVKEVNKSFERILGYKYLDIIDKNIIDNIIPPEYKETVNKYLEWDSAPPYEITAIHKNGKKIPVEIESRNMKYKGDVMCVAAIRDISKRKETQSDLKRFHTAVEQSANTIVITDKLGDIQYVNLKFTVQTGYSQAEVIGKNLKFLKSGKQSAKFYQQLWNTINQGKVWSGELCNKKKNGELYWEFMTITPVLDSTNKIANFIAVKEDITSKKQEERNLLNAIIDTEERERKRFAEDLHDELGPFLSGINLYINELGYKDVNYEKRSSIIDYLKYFVNEAVEKTRSISHQLMPNILFDYGLIVALEAFCNKIDFTKKIKIKINSNIKERIGSKTVEVVIYRMAIELINNTIKHADATQIIVDLNVVEDIFEFIYSDNGIGFKLNQQLKDNKGLGLQNTINRLQSLEGTYTFTSTKNNGVLYKFAIPL